MSEDSFTKMDPIWEYLYYTYCSLILFFFLTLNVVLLGKILIFHVKISHTSILLFSLSWPPSPLSPGQPTAPPTSPILSHQWQTSLPKTKRRRMTGIIPLNMTLCTKFIYRLNTARNSLWASPTSCITTFPSSKLSSCSTSDPRTCIAFIWIQR